MKKTKWTVVKLEDFTAKELLDYVVNIPNKNITLHIKSGYEGEWSHNSHILSDDERKNIRDLGTEVGYIYKGGLTVVIKSVEIIMLTKLFEEINEKE